MKKTYQITEKGKGDLEVELTDLKSRRGEIAEKIAVARDFGDLRENAEYDAARKEQGLVETRIAEIEEILQNAEIIQSSDGSAGGLGGTGGVQSSDKTVTYTVVGPVEADPLAGKISNESPIGKEVMGKKVGDEVKIKTPKAEMIYIVKSIS